jgi:hypothetical protein
VANASGATVIDLQSHPLWVAAQRRKRERMEAMRRHPSSLVRQRAGASTSDVHAGLRKFKALSSNDTPA